MDTCRPTFYLIARWRHTKDVYSSTPDYIRWDDGSPATFNDYLNHQYDTQECLRRKNGLEIRIFPELIADVKFNPTLGAWGIEGAGVDPSILAEHDPEASDDSVLCAVCKLPIYYRVRIHRVSRPSTTVPLLRIVIGAERQNGGTDRNYVRQYCLERGID
jgi:hypothetical protein